MHRVDRSPSWCHKRSFSRRPPQRAASRSTARAGSGSAATVKKQQKPRLSVRSTQRDAAALAGKATHDLDGGGSQPQPKNRSAGRSQDGVATVRLARGTGKTAKPAAGKPAIKRAAGGSGQRGPVAASVVQTVEIRPSARVTSRRPEVRRPPVHHLPHHPVVPFVPPAWMLEECQISPARAGEQSEILQLLAGLPTPPTRAEFHASVDHPEHDSANRLVARLGGRIVGHVEIVPRSLVVGSATVTGAVVDRVAVLPECRGAGHGQRLVKAAEDRMRQAGAVLAFSRTRIAASFHELGWSVLGRDCATPGRPTEIVARLLEGPQRAGETVTMRQWRHVELPAILRIYGQNARRFVGPLDRDENYGRWLVSRGAFDSILVALVGQDRYELQESSARIVGYCIQSGNRVLEIMADPEFVGLEQEILARVCAEAIENDRQQIVYESSASDPLHAAVAGGDGRVAQGDRMIVAKVFRPQVLLEAVAPAVAERVIVAGIRETVELGLDAPSFRGSVIVAEGKGQAKGERQATVHPGRIGRSYLRLSDDELGRLLLGQCDPVEAVAAGRMDPSTQMAQKLAGQLFPRQPLWCPMWDDLPA
jgi:GNAT superfamily N-acetyltransferase